MRGAGQAVRPKGLTAVAGEFAGVDQDERFELLLDLFVGGLARRAATDE